MGPKRDSKTNPTRPPCCIANNQDNILEEMKQLIGTTCARIEQRIGSVEEQTKNQRDELISLVNIIEVKANKAINLGESNASKIQANSSNIEGNDFEIDQLKNKVASLNKELNEFRVDLGDMRYRCLRKTLIFQDIPFKKKETWEESKKRLVKEIKAVIPDLEKSYIMNKIERAHRSKQAEYSNTSAIITKFNDWQLTETIKTSFIKVLLKPSHIYLYLKCIHQRSLKEGMKQ